MTLGGVELLPVDVGQRHRGVILGLGKTLQWTDGTTNHSVKKLGR